VNPFESRAPGLAPEEPPTEHPLRAPCGVCLGPHSTDVAPDHAPLRGRIEPQVSERLTAPAQLRHASFTRPGPAFGIGLDVVLIGRRHLTAALSTTCEVEELPLAFVVAPRARSGFWPAAFRVTPRTASTPSSSKPDACSTQNAFHRRMPLEGPPGCPEDSPIPLVCRIEGPATGLSASPPRSGFRRLFASRCARAPRG